MMLRETRTHAIVPDSLTAFKYISAFKKFAINNGMSAAVADLVSAETVMERKFLQRRNNATQTSFTGYFQTARTIVLFYSHITK